MDDIKYQLAECCKQLKLSSGLAERAMTMQGDSHQEYLVQLLTKELEYRRKRRVTTLTNAAKFPRRYKLENFRADEIDFQGDSTLAGLLRLDFLHSGKNVVMYGSTGTGKTMLSILIGMEACRQNIPVRFFRAASLVNQLAEQHVAGTLSSFKKKLSKIQILIIDEFGYIPYDKTGAQLLFDYLSEIHENKSVILNTNLEFSQWGNILYDYKMATALIGRLTHHVELVLFPGGNNRLRESSINDRIKQITASGKDSHPA